MQVANVDNGKAAEDKHVLMMEFDVLEVEFVGDGSIGGHWDEIDLVRKGVPGEVSKFLIMCLGAFSMCWRST
jgi:hypothetical protein